MILDIDQARQSAGIDLISSSAACDSAGLRFAELEDESESNTHKEMRHHGIAYFAGLGYDIYPSGIGVRGTYTLADFAAVRGRRVIFVECLTDRNVTEEVVARKAKLTQHGEIAFITIAGSGDLHDCHRTPELVASLEKTFDVFGYRYGHYHNGFTKSISPLTLFPRSCFEVDVGGAVQVSLDFDVRRVRCVVRLGFATKPLVAAVRLANRPLIIFRYEVMRRFSLTARSGTVLDISHRGGLKLCGSDGCEAIRIVGDDGGAVLTFTGSESAPILPHLIGWLSGHGVVPVFDAEALERAVSRLSQGGSAKA